ncbi:MAG: hypothetical protein ACHBNF_02155 [Chromatiales bacterium]
MDTDEQAADHERRSREVADTTRRFLVGVNTGGIAVTFAVATALIREGIRPKWAIFPVSFFLASLVLIGISLLLAKHRELERRDAAQGGKESPNVTMFLWRSFFWDSFALTLFVLGAITGLMILWDGGRL